MLDTLFANPSDASLNLQPAVNQTPQPAGV
jgi:hypothetical protein